MPFGYWIVKGERSIKGKFRIPRESKFWEQPSPTTKTNNPLKYLDFSMLTEEGANELGILQNTPNPLKENRKKWTNLYEGRGGGGGSENPTHINRGKFPATKLPWSTSKLADNTPDGRNIFKQELGDAKSYLESEIPKLRIDMDK